MANSETTPKRKSTTKKTATKKSPAKKPASGAKKAPTKRKPTTKKPAAKKSTVNVKDIPVGLLESGKTGSTNLGNSIVSNKRKKRKKKSKLNAEKIFWIVVAILVIGTGLFAVFFVFQDYNKDPSTPAQLSVETISDENIEYIEGLTSGSDLIEGVSTTEQGPIIYVIYTTQAGTPKADVMNAISEAYKAGVADKPDIFETYSFQITIITSEEEAEGVNDYPIMGALNVGRGNISWMATDGTFVEPTEEGTTE